MHARQESGRGTKALLAAGACQLAVVVACRPAVVAVCRPAAGVACRPAVAEVYRLAAAVAYRPTVTEKIPIAAIFLRGPYSLNILRRTVINQRLRQFEKPTVLQAFR